MQPDVSWVSKFVQPLRVAPGTTVSLPGSHDPAERFGFRQKQDGTDLMRRGAGLLAQYQARLAAEGTRAVLVLLQGMDAAGKDGTIRHVMSGVNPQGVHVSSFKTPSAAELGHDYLWRQAVRLPSRGEIGIFNRSHYEEVLVVRVHPEYLAQEKVPAAGPGPDGIWARRFGEINDWERYLTDNGIRVVKLFLNLSRKEQRRRFLKRIDEPDKNWKFSAADIAERRYWDQYQQAYSQLLTHTSTTWAPWHVVPADRKWFTRICATAIIAQALIELDPRYPVPGKQARDDLRRARAELEAG